MTRIALRGRTGIVVAGIALAALTMVGGVAATGRAACQATVYVDVEPHDTAEKLLSSLQESYGHDAREGPMEERSTYEAVARLASAAELVQDGAIRRYAAVVEHGEADMTISQVEAGWVVNSIRVPVSQATCDYVTERARAR